MSSLPGALPLARQSTTFQSSSNDCSASRSSMIGRDSMALIAEVVTTFSLE